MASIRVSSAGVRDRHRGRRESSGTSTRAVAVDALAHLEAVPARHERRAASGRRGCTCRAGCRGRSRARRGSPGSSPAPCGRRVRSVSALMTTVVPWTRSDTSSSETSRPRRRRARPSADRRASSRPCRRSASPRLVVERDEIGERAADVGRGELAEAHASRAAQARGASPRASQLERREGSRRDAVLRAGLLERDVAVEDVVEHALRLALARVAEAAARPGDGADEVAVLRARRGRRVRDARLPSARSYSR